MPGRWGHLVTLEEESSLAGHVQACSYQPFIMLGSCTRLQRNGTGVKLRSRTLVAKRYLNRTENLCMHDSRSVPQFHNSRDGCHPPSSKPIRPSRRPQLIFPRRPQIVETSLSDHGLEWKFISWPSHMVPRVWAQMSTKRHVFSEGYRVCVELPPSLWAKTPDDVWKGWPGT